MNQIGKSIVDYFATNIWLVEIIITLSSGLLVSWLEGFVYRRVKVKLENTIPLWDLALLEAIHYPLQLFIWVMVVSLLLPIILSIGGLGVEYIPYISPVREIFFVILLLWVTLRFITNMERAIFDRPTVHGRRVKDLTTVRAVSQVVRVIVITVAALILMQTVGIRITALLAFGGVGALAVSFAAKDTLSNFLGGMMIFWDRPFSVGDWIRSPDRQIEGTVEHIGWRLTRIRTFDKRPLYVPNGTFSTVAIENPSRMTNRRIYATIGLRYDDATKIHGILEDIEKMLRSHPEIDSNQTLMVNLVEFASYSLNFMIYTFTKTTNWVKFQAVQQDVFLKIIDIVAQHKAEFAFPTNTIHVPQGLAIKNFIEKEQ